MNPYQQVAIIVAAFWFLWTLEILYRKKNWESYENKNAELVAWMVLSIVMVVVDIIMAFLGYFK